MNDFKAVPSGSEVIRFTKMHGLGNDYVYLLLEDNPRLAQASEQELACLARAVSDRHTGVGGDGMVMITPPTRLISECVCGTPMAPKRRCAEMPQGAWVKLFLIRD